MIWVGTNSILVAYPTWSLLILYLRPFVCSAWFTTIFTKSLRHKIPLWRPVGNVNKQTEVQTLHVMQDSRYAYTFVNKHHPRANMFINLSFIRILCCIFYQFVHRTIFNDSYYSTFLSVFYVTTTISSA